MPLLPREGWHITARFSNHFSLCAAPFFFDRRAQMLPKEPSLAVTLTLHLFDPSLLQAIRLLGEERR
jgi:hypothetical protein